MLDRCVFLCLLLLCAACSQPDEALRSAPDPVANPALTATDSIPVRRLPVAGPLHPQEAEILPDDTAPGSGTIHFARTGSRVTFFVYDLRPDLPNYLTYRLAVERGGVRVQCATETQDCGEGDHSRWLPIPNHQMLETVQVFSLLPDTTVRIESIGALAVDLTHPPAYDEPQPETIPFTNAGFEQGTLENWEAQGEAFLTQPTFEDNPAFRQGYDGAYPSGRYWVGTFENRPGPLTPPRDVQEDAPRGSLVSQSFVVDHRFLSGLIAGGPLPKCGVSILIDGQEVARFTPMQGETLQPFVFDIGEYKGRKCRLLIQDQESAAWGHINADSFCVFGG